MSAQYIFLIYGACVYECTCIKRCIPMRLKVAETFISGMNKVTETPKMGVEWYHENYSINLHDTSRYMAEILLIRRKHQYK